MYEEFNAKNGNPYGRFTIEDQTGALQFSLFKENYLNCRNILTVNSFVMLSGVMDRPFPRAGQDPSIVLQTLEVRFNEARLLDSLLETTTKTVCITLYLSKIDKNENVLELDKADMDEFIRVIKENPGKQNYKIQLVDVVGKKSCNMSPIKGAVNAQEVLPLLEKMPFVEFDLR